MNKINKLLFFLLILFISSGFITLFTVSASTGTVPYEFEVGIPGIVPKGGSLPAMSLNNVLNKIIKGLFPIAGILAFVMIVWAGFEYATSGGNTNLQKDAQDRIANAIIGLLLLFAFYIIIYTINPDILKTQNLELTPVNLNNNHNYSGQIPQNLNITLQKGLLTVPSDVNNDYLANQLSTKINTLTTTYSWRVTDACIGGFNHNNDFPCKTTCLPGEPDCITRSVNDAHYYGLAVDITTNNDPDNKNLVLLAKEICNRGLDVLIESNHLHVTLSQTDYKALGITNTVMGISPGKNEKWSMGQWYTQGHCND